MTATVPPAPTAPAGRPDTSDHQFRSVAVRAQVAVEPRTLSQRTIVRRLRDLAATGVCPDPVIAEAATELSRLTARPDLSQMPVIDLVEQLDETGIPLAAEAAEEIRRLREMCRTLFFDCETHTSHYRPGTVTIAVPARLHALIRTEARRP
jgi:hypothetical protein